LFTKVICGLLFSSALYAQTLQPPQTLTVVSATNKQVQLRWTAGDTTATGYVIERKPLGGNYTTALTATGTTANDTNFDPYTAYTYRVRGTQQSNQSGPSNEVTVGPPPYGYNTAVASPSADDDNIIGHFGSAVSMILDTSGDPALAYNVQDPNNDGDYSDGRLYFVRWDRAHYQWTKPVQVAVVGDVEFGNLTPASLAQDPTNGAIGMAYQDESTADSDRISFSISSDGGVTWKAVKVTGDDSSTAYERPSLAMNAGNVYLTFYHDFDGILYVTGKQSDDPSKWTSTLVPLPGGYDHYWQVSSLALDSRGVPAVAFVVDGDPGMAEAFWRPGGSSVLIWNNNGEQTDDPDLRLTFSGTQPRVVFAGALDDNYFADYDHSIWVMSSPDNGATWARPANVVSDLGTTLDAPVSIAAGPQGQVAIVMDDNGGNGTSNCTEPKIAMSTDLVNWTTCGTDTAGVYSINAISSQVAFAGNGSLLVGFQQTEFGDDNSLPTGVLVWRQPAAWSFPPPPPPQE
jgi:hypothetical protein